MDPRTSEENANAAHGMRSHEECWTPGCGDFTAATRVLFSVSYGDSRDRIR